ncbi:MAG: glycoside hydrolase family 3 N-terminal domain-containing protein, partial [Ignavibacteria bacterium]
MKTKVNIYISGILIQLFIIFFIVRMDFPQSSSKEKSDAIEKKVADLLSKMTLDEKIGQLVQFSGTNAGRDSLVRKGYVGSFLNIRGASEVNRVQKIAVEESRLGIPLIIGNDVIHGYQTTFPIPLAEASSWNPELVTKASEIAAWEASANGTHWTFGPMVDIAFDPRWGRIAEGAGEDPYLGSVMAEAQVKGFQGDNFIGNHSIVACAKHYAAYGAAQGGRDYNTVDISERTLREIYLPPFKAAVDAGAGTLMSAFNDLNGIPASANYLTLTQILRNEWGFDGFVVSDWNSIAELINHGIAKDKKEAAFKGIAAGVDMDMAGDVGSGNVYLPYLKSLVEEGLISEETINKSAERILRIKFRFGLFEHPYVDSIFFAKNIPSKEERDLAALQLSRESIVLLKNEENLLPLKKELNSIAVIGPLADNQEDPLGPWSTNPIVEDVVTVLKGIREKVSDGTNVTYAKGCAIESMDRSGFDEAVKIARGSDMVIMVMGESRDMSGEAGSRADINLPGVQLELIQKIYELGKPVAVVLMNGRPMTIEWIDENIPAVVESWFLGTQTGNAVADVLFGDFNPCGKLPVSFPRYVGQIPVNYNYKSTGRPYNPNQKFTSRYIDYPNSPLYPFGFGLSYSEYTYSNLKLQKLKIKKNENVKAWIDITNNGKAAGKEVVQLYIRDLAASVTSPVKELKGFQKIELKPGETKTVEFTITPKMLSLLDINLKEIIESGEFRLMIGGNSEDLLEIS